MAISQEAVIREIAGYVDGARRIAVLTGAGISTPSGIPDFRSAQGFYSDERNANAFDINEFQRDPRFFYRFASEFYPMVARAQPNAAHRILAKWEKNRKDVRIATQNIDDLHQRAGSRYVFPVHGTIETSSCYRCHKSCKSESLLATVLAGQIPRCECGGVYKPEVTFFGELLPETAWNDSVEAMSKADLVLVIGTSLVVYPAASLPEYRSPRARLVIVNRDPTLLDDTADAVTHDELTEVMEAVDAAMPSM